MFKLLAKWLVARVQARRAREYSIASERLALLEPPKRPDLLEEFERRLRGNDADGLGNCAATSDGLLGDGSASLPVQQSLLRQPIGPRHALTIVWDRTLTARGDLPRR